ncbi:hypothetical protein YA0016_27015 [Pseudomonas syringae]|uniref:hypothetical protein n=1 Tax=Pseudomonas syringae group TaxID=136849 RepID=UPI000CF72A2B|nr:MULTISPECIES: hypothetical protein [Pseudomonas syringae group]AVI87312.1 hypothetical protein XJ28_28195 [Pseudomonas syringae pv. tomato]MBI6845365.1 hypothetical protein [Pseudomonas syringae]QBI60908.1 hypothetical protein EIZ61_05095 [Pseudomonas syringae]
MHAENTTAPPATQEPSEITFTAEQKRFIADLLIAERKHASRWWTYLNEMRLAKQLPEWCSDRKDVGNALDYDNWAKDCSATSWALLGFSGHLNRFEAASGKDALDLADSKWATLDDKRAPRNVTPLNRGAHGDDQ